MLAELEYNCTFLRDDTTSTVLYVLYCLCAHYFTRTSHQLSTLSGQRPMQSLPSVVTCLLSSEATSADSVITHLLWLRQFPSPVT